MKVKFLKENQIIIYIAALMLITAGYLNYADNRDNQTVGTSSEATTNTTNTGIKQEKIADIGDAALVNSNPTASTEETSTAESSPETSPSPEASATPSEDTTAVNSSDYFVTSKLERDKMYSQILEVYQKVLDSSTTEDAQKQIAVEEIQKINNSKNSITVCENLIKTKGFNNSVIFVNGESVSVVVGSTGLTQEQVDEIQNLIQREMNASPENIHIAIN